MKSFCKTPEKIENYELALKDNFKGWDRHHRIETHCPLTGLLKPKERRISTKVLIKLNLYFDRPASELIFIKHNDHMRLHNLGNTFNVGRKHTEECKKARSERYKGSGNPNYGKHASEETRRKISEAGKGRKHSLKIRILISLNSKDKPKPWRKEALTGCHWFNNGTVSKQLRECPKGWKIGRLYRNKH